jgi:hypothetical protein
MQRNWDVIRELLLRVEQCTVPSDYFQLGEFPEERHAEIGYHMEILIEAGLVQGHVLKTFSPDPRGFIAQRLTWDGHEFLDSIRSDSVWSRTKKVFAEKGISMTIETVASVAKEAATALLKGALGG